MRYIEAIVPTVAVATDHVGVSCSTGSTVLGSGVYSINFPYPVAGVYTIPQEGIYNINAVIQTTAQSQTAGLYFLAYLQTGGSITRQILGNYDYVGSTAAKVFASRVDTFLRLQQGDTLSVVILSTIAGSTVTNANTFTSMIEIRRIGTTKSGGV